MTYAKTFVALTGVVTLCVLLTLPAGGFIWNKRFIASPLNPSGSVPSVSDSIGRVARSQPPPPPAAAFTMANTFTDWMVLQHSEPVVGGRCPRGQTMELTLASSAGRVVQAVRAKCGAATGPSGDEFLASFAPQPPSAQHYSIAARMVGTAAEVKVSAAMFGTVILCGGQSNMAYPTSHELNATHELELATTDNYPLVRLFGLRSANTSSEVEASVPRYSTGWANVSVPGLPAAAQPVGQFSAVCWNMGQTLSGLFKEAGEEHPLGLVDASLGSTRAECWMPPAAIDSCKATYAKSVRKQDVGNCTHGTWSGPPGTFYNGMIYPLTLSLRLGAAVYYQGENNMWDEVDVYQCSGDQLAAAWRRAFRAPQAPWFIVQLAPCCGDNDGLVAGSDIREAQRRSSLAVPDAHLIVINDIGDAGKNPSKPSGWGPQTHPTDKEDPGRRLGLSVWGRLFRPAASALVTTPPVVGAVERSADGVTLTVSFAHADGLHWKSTHNCTAYVRAPETECCNRATQVAQFTNTTAPPGLLVPSNYRFHEDWADSPAVIEAGGKLQIKVPSEKGPALTWFRIQYDSQPLCVLANEAQLPTSLFVLPVPNPGEVLEV